MKYNTLQRAILEAKRFIVVAEQVQKGWGEGSNAYCQEGRNAAAAKRSSMDLTRALADMRGGK